MIKKMAMNGRKHIQESIEGSHILFVVAGVGGEEGSGLAQAVAQIAHEMDILTIALTNKPIGTGSDE
jgi:cell division protein FtsZ